ncbi:uncharacterized protein [Miscanthus floridulus]|uniref:uncharacterized protein n=1 Tax=Miscanthus floridulus TaxID=154761 RepID=UPI003458C12F
MAGTCLPLAALLLATAVTLLVATSAVSVAAAADKYSGRMIIIRAPGASVPDVSGGALNKWQQRRMVEDEVAPDLGGLLAGAGDPRGISYGALDPNKPVCLHGNCAAQGRPITGRPCASLYGCPHTPTAAHARAVHV